MSGNNEILSKAEDIADKVTRHSKHILPHLARFCLVSTFFEDGVRMWVQWSEQREYMDISWGCGWFIATMFVVINLVGQLGSVAMVLTRYKVDIACGVLFHRGSPDYRLQHPVGSSVPLQESCSYWSFAAGPGRVSS